MLSVRKCQRNPHKAFIQNHQHCESVSNAPAPLKKSREEVGSNGKEDLSARVWHCIFLEASLPAGPAPEENGAPASTISPLGALFLSGS